VTGARLPHNAAAIARLARPIERKSLQAGDLVFFNTRNKPYSHVGIYVGDNRFVHAPSRNGKIQLANLSDRYFDQRFDSARTLLQD
jgi:cell wall-associated NlpC family hydrolase